MRDDFEALRDLEETVAVGRDTLKVVTSRLYQDKVVFAALGRLHLDTLLTTLASTLEELGAVEWLDRKGGQEIDVMGALRRVLPKLPTLLPKLWAAARDVLGEQLVPFIEETALVMLDTRENAKLLVDAGKLTVAACDPSAPGAWRGNAHLKDYLLDNLSTAQAAAVVAASFRVSKWGDVLGNLMPLAKGTPAAKATTQG